MNRYSEATTKEPDASAPGISGFSAFGVARPRHAIALILMVFQWMRVQLHPSHRAIAHDI